MKMKAKKCMSVLIAFSMLFGFGVSSPSASAAKKKVKAKSLALNYKNKTLRVGKTVKLKATVKPKKAKANINWSTSNKRIAAVNRKGTVSAKKKGSAKITAAVKGTKLKKTCRIMVKGSSPSSTTPKPTNTPYNAPATPIPTKAAPTATPVLDTVVITGPDNVDKAFSDAKANAKITKIKIETQNAVEIKLPEGDYSNYELIVNAPQAEVINYAKFKKITINQVAADTYTEYAQGNTIDVNCPIGRMVITESALAEINITKQAASVSLVVDGKVSAINITGKDSTVDISGTTSDSIPVNADTETEIKTSHILNVKATAIITFVIYPGAEDSECSVENDSLLPKVFGIGSIKVMITASGDIQTLIAEYLDDVTDEQGIVTLEGSIIDYDSEEPIKDATVNLVPYTNNFDENTIESSSALKQATTDEEGTYHIDSIRTGNYIMAVKEEGMVTAIQYLVITSRYGDTFQNETLRLFPQTANNEPGTITGILSNSVDGAPIEGLTARLRKGKGNTTGSVMAKTVSDAEGSYIFEDVAPGYYTVEFVDLRTGQEDGNYITTSMNAVVRSNSTDVVSTALTKSVSASQVRFVLTWGDESSGAPADLDSHLTGPKKTGSGHFHTYFSERAFSTDGVDYADLDHDDTDYEGPETSTIYEAVPGIYEFYVHDYTNKDSSHSTALGTSHAKVEVYQGTTLMLSYYVPNSPGTVWHVCSYDSTTGTLTQNNEMYYESSPSEIGNDPKDSALNQLEISADTLGNILDSLKDNEAKTSLIAIYNENKEFATGNSSNYTLEDIQERIEKLADLIEELANSFYITEIIFEEDNNYNINNYYSSITIEAIDPSAVNIEDITLADGASYKLVKKNGIITAIEVSSASGYVKTYTVDYTLPYISLDTVEGSNVSSWETDYDYDVDDNMIDYLYIYTTDGKSGNFTAKASSDKVDISYKRDADHQITSVTLSIGSYEKTYLVKYSLDLDLLLPANVTSDDGEYYSYHLSRSYDDNDEAYYTLVIETESGNTCNFTVEPSTEEASVTYSKSDDGVIENVTITIGEHSVDYPVRYEEW